MHEVSESRDKGLSVTSCFFDLSKAFDRVWHAGLLKKLQHLGLKDTALQWMINYLTHRRQRVRVGDAFSEWQAIPAGVPQGSVLGHPAVLIYTIDLPSACTNSNTKCSQFADDTALIATHQSRLLSELSLQSAVSAAVAWLRRWHLLVNARNLHRLHSPGYRVRQSRVIQHHPHTKGPIRTRSATSSPYLLADPLFAPVHHSSLLHHLQLPTLVSRQLLRQVTLAHNIKYIRAPLHLQQPHLARPITEQLYALRHMRTYTLRTSHTYRHTNSPINLSLHNFNQLPPNLRLNQRRLASFYHPYPPVVLVVHTVPRRNPIPLQCVGFPTC